MDGHSYRDDLPTETLPEVCTHDQAELVTNGASLISGAPIMEAHAEAENLNQSINQSRQTRRG